MANYTPIRKGKRILNFQESLTSMKTLPSIFEVVDRYKCLQKRENGKPKKVILRMLAKELEEVWTTQDVPVQPYFTIVKKLSRIVQKKEGSVHQNLIL